MTWYNEISTFENIWKLFLQFFKFCFKILISLKHVVKFFEASTKKQRCEHVDRIVEKKLNYDNSRRQQATADDMCLCYHFMTMTSSLRRRYVVVTSALRVSHVFHVKICEDDVLQDRWKKHFCCVHNNLEKHEQPRDQHVFHVFICVHLFHVLNIYFQTFSKKNILKHLFFVNDNLFTSSFLWSYCKLFLFQVILF